MLVRESHYYIPLLDNVIFSKRTEIVVMVLSDLHFGNSFDLQDAELLRVMRDFAQEENPDIIILAGDVVDSLDILDFPEATQALCEVIQRLAYYAPVYVGIGNHDQCCYHEGLLAPNSSYFQGYLSELKQLGQDTRKAGLCPIRILHNDSVGDRTGLGVTGITLPPSYYGLDLWQDYSRESEDVLIDTLVEQSVLYHRQRYQLVLIHSPLYLTPSLLANALPRNSLVISGHMHNGCMPIGLYGLTQWSGRGIIAPDKSLFPTEARYKVPAKWMRGLDSSQLSQDTAVRQVTVGPVRTFPSWRKVLNPIGRVICPCEISFIHLGREYEKPSVRRKLRIK